jgi:hypothetical protein
MQSTTIKLHTPARKDEMQRAAKEAELNGHGGAREGAGRKPKALYYARELADAEGKIIAALPELIETLIRQAKAGDSSAAKYLLDRVFGRVETQSKPLAEDTSQPYTEEDAERAARQKEFDKSWDVL